LVLKRTVEFMREQIADREVLVGRIEAAGGEVDDKMKTWVP
jgi:septum formation protein